ncbi:2-dehydropantoate 2-reductase [Flavobacterium sp. Fl-318]|uniref:2-dehydropantoate 2-reductase n=1 Tax=Flavobacterium cupriresistens TaxID=2893885 RepID=A0ABU4RGW0_9FLAO|nr:MULTISPECIES: 2-dehydropantoate 2-reductase [unclassified Flavobacterium]MDX6191813.1 2-dehydropantoate 2-reductase [Flavobacterium sp. Fl-318]UFH41756.1 2-dehydropantoate 2-reductase [Flavobacterium sp. F-323]
MNSATIKIGILGIGGIGGFIGAPLAKKYQNTNVQIIFICRGETKNNIQNKGLIFESKDKTETVHPYLASDNPSEIGTLDVILLSCKSYSINEMLSTYKDCITADTQIITLQNVVNAAEIIGSILPDSKPIIEGCIYVASNVKKPGHIQHIGGPGKIFIGGSENSKWITDILLNGNLDITQVDTIKEILWKKYLFVAPVAAITSAYKVSFGALLENKELMHILENMMIEIQSLAGKNNIVLTHEDIETAKNLLDKFPYQSKSSLQLDFENNNKTEKSFLVDYVIDECFKNGIMTPFYSAVNDKIKSLYGA